jgi:diguanylate cyclase (GGDEF)-like protein
MEAVFAPGDVLLIADTPAAEDRLRGCVEATGARLALLSCPEALLMEHGDEEQLDLVLTSFETVDPTSQAVLERLISFDLFPDVPRIHLCPDLRLRESLLSKGIDAAYVMLSPPDVEELSARVRLAATIGRLRRELSHSAVRDPLTGLFNRGYIVQRLEEEFSRARRYHTPVSLVLVDIDQLKRINDARGQQAGNSAIHQVSQLVRSHVRREDVLGRTGEESYGVILPGNRYRGAAVFANKVRTEAEQLLIEFHGEDLRVRVSAGISTYPDNPAIESADDLMSATEDALVQAKSRGGNRVFIDEGVLHREKRLVLVADPDSTLLDLAEDLLALDDLRVVRAESARAALETLRFRRPDVLILDLGLADSTLGLDLLQRVNEMSPEGRFPIIGLSKDPRANPEQLLRLGVDRFITKPFSLSVLRGVVRELIEAYR